MRDCSTDPYSIGGPYPALSAPFCNPLIQTQPCQCNTAPALQQSSLEILSKAAEKPPSCPLCFPVARGSKPSTAKLPPVRMSWDTCQESCLDPQPRQRSSCLVRKPKLVEPGRQAPADHPETSARNR